MRRLIFITFLVLLSACDGDKPIVETRDADQCLRRVIFQECMKLLPAGPLATKYNDWDEVVDSCGQQAYYQSLRYTRTIKEECK